MKFSIGDRVVVTDVRHPYYRYSGVITHRYISRNMNYKLLLDKQNLISYVEEYQLDFDFSDLLKEKGVLDDEKQATEPKCTCGTDKTNQPGHSDWCDKYEK